MVAAQDSEGSYQALQKQIADLTRRVNDEMRRLDRSPIPDIARRGGSSSNSVKREPPLQKDRK